MHIRCNEYLALSIEYQGVNLKSILKQSCMKQTSTDIQKITFPVSDVEINTRHIPGIPYRDALNEKWGIALEACSENGKELVYDDDFKHSLLLAAQKAFCHHYPLVLSPDMFWLMICQGFARHINENSETFRHRFVKHSGKEIIEIRRDDFIKGSPDNAWQEAFTEFSEKIQDRIQADLYKLLVPSFSTTTETEKAAFEVAFMESMASYFEYRVRSFCGIPSITLEGSPQDWQQIIDNTNALAEYDLEWWTSRIIPILEKIKATAEGQVDTAFWQSFFKYESMSGSEGVTGWIPLFLPYFQNHFFDENQEEWVTEGLIRNPLLEKTIEEFFQQEYPEAYGFTFFPPGLSKVPFIWQYLTIEFKMEFIAGFVGIHYDPETQALRPEIGWMVAEQGVLSHLN